MNAGIYEHVTINDEQMKEAGLIREKASELENLLNAIIPSDERSEPARMRNLAKTNLEQVVMWAVKAISRK